MRQPGTPFWDVYRLFNIKDLRFDGVYWKAAAYQTPKVLPSEAILKTYHTTASLLFLLLLAWQLTLSHESAMPLAQIIALFFICAFGSSLDVAAIQGESPEPLDFNHELQTVGLPVFCSSCSVRVAKLQSYMTVGHGVWMLRLSVWFQNSYSRTLT